MFVRLYDAAIDRSVEAMLRSALPGYRWQTLRLGPELRRHPGMAAAAAETAVRHGADVVRGRVRFRSALVRAAVTQHLIRRIVRRTVRSVRPALVFQIQSLYDASTPGVPHFVYTDHTMAENARYPEGVALRWPTAARRAEASVYAAARVVFCRSTNIARSLVDDYGIAPERVEIVGAGPNTPVPAVPADPGASTTVLFVGRDWVRKGGPQLLAAWERVAGRLPGARLRILGCSPATDLPGVEVLGDRPVDEVAAEMARAAVLCVPTRREPFGLVFVEAMAHGLPVVATRVGALPDLVSDGVTGRLVDPDDIDGLAAALTGLLADAGLRRRMGAAARREALERWTWDRVGAAVARRVRRELGTPTDGPAPR